MVAVSYIIGNTFVAAGIQGDSQTPVIVCLLVCLNHIKDMEDFSALPLAHGANSAPCIAPCNRSAIRGQLTERDRKQLTHTSGRRIHLEQASVNHSTMTCRVIVPQF